MAVVAMRPAFVEGGVLVDTGQGVEVAFGSLAGDLGAAVQIGDASP
jgi:hypothetical protein